MIVPAPYWTTYPEAIKLAGGTPVIVDTDEASGYRATVEQLLGFRPGDFVELDMEPVIQAKVDGVPVFDCQYGVNDGHYAIKIEKLLTSSETGWLGVTNHGR